MLIPHPKNLLRAMQWVAILSTGEATAALRDYRAARDGQQHPDQLRYGGGEAVSHFGGPREVIQRAIRVRHTLRVGGVLHA
jgi:hypothetical protein